MSEFNRRQFLQTTGAALLWTAVPRGAAAVTAAPSVSGFPCTVQISPLPGDGPGWHGEAGPLSPEVIRATIDDILAHGFTCIEAPIATVADVASRRALLDYAISRGMQITYQAGSMELFHRDLPPAISVYSPEYAVAVKKKVAEALAPVQATPHVYNVFCYMDEPFHSGKRSLPTDDATRGAFMRRFGREMPLDIDTVRDKPQEWLDLLNFHSDNFPYGWRQVYQAVKAVDARFKVVLTHDSHTCFGGGVDSNAKVAIDDAFHWGADFADLIVFDIYPYMFYDFRYGQCGKLPKPRFSQMHYAFAHLRNLTQTYHKELGFWFGTYNKRWFHGFMREEVKKRSWSEHEVILTAVAQGADYLISGLNIPQVPAHWEGVGRAMNLLQKLEPGLRRAPRLKARAAFLFPRTQYLQTQQEYWNVGLSYELMLRSLGELDLLHEEQITDSTLNGYELLVLCDVSLLPKAVAERVAEFVRNGGTVIADCVPQSDGVCQPLAEMNELFGVRWCQTGRIRRRGVWVPKQPVAQWFTKPNPDEEAEVAEMQVHGAAFGYPLAFNLVSPRLCDPVSAEVLVRAESGNPVLLQRSVGKGKVFLLSFCLQDTYFRTFQRNDDASRQNLQALIERMASVAGVRGHVHSSNPEIEAAVRAGESEAYLFVIRHEAEKPSTRITLSGLPFVPARGTNVESGASLSLHSQGDGTVSADMRLEPGDAFVFRLTPA